MANTAYWLDDFTTLDLETSGATPTPVAGIQNVTIVPQVSIEKLYTADSIKVDTQKQHEAMVNVSIGYSKFDADVVKEWLDGATEAGATSWSDTSDPQKYSLTGTFVEADGTDQIDVTVTGITFEEMPIMDAARGEYVQWDLEGEGEDITNFDVTLTP